MALSGQVLLQGQKETDFSRMRLALQPHFLFSTGAPFTRVNSDGTFVIHVGADLYRIELSGLPEDFYIESIRLADQEQTDRILDMTHFDKPPGRLEITVNGNGASVDGIANNTEHKPVPGAFIAKPLASRWSVLFRPGMRFFASNACAGADLVPPLPSLAPTSTSSRNSPKPPEFRLAVA